MSAGAVGAVVDRVVVPRGAPEPTVSPSPILSRASSFQRRRTMARIGLQMAVHDRMKFAAALIGVVFAVLLSGQQAATFLAIVNRNVMVVDNKPDVDIWVMPPETEILQPGKLRSQAPLNQARGTPGVAWAEPILMGGATGSRPEGGSEQAVLIGTRGPAWKGLSRHRCEEGRCRGRLPEGALGRDRGGGLFQRRVITVGGFVRYFVIFVIALKTRRVHVAGVTCRADGEWMAQIGRNVTHASA